jgi:hypothetical protein
MTMPPDSQAASLFHFGDIKERTAAKKAAVRSLCPLSFIGKPSFLKPRRRIGQPLSYFSDKA